jgi:DNA-binding Lrp family transcriptional regulator
MLERLLAEIRLGGTLETGALALRLGTSPAMVKAMLDHLQRRGYIQPYQAALDACRGCSLRRACGKTDACQISGSPILYAAEA